jgi:hypothetical protein
MCHLADPVAAVRPQLGRVAVVQDRHDRRHPEVAEVVDPARVAERDALVDAEMPLDVEGRLLDLRVERRDREADAGQPRGRSGRLADVQVLVRPAERDRGSADRVDRQQVASAGIAGLRAGQADHLVRLDAVGAEVNRGRVEDPGDARGEDAVGSGSFLRFYASFDCLY